MTDRLLFLGEFIKHGLLLLLEIRRPSHHLLPFLLQKGRCSLFLLSLLRLLFLPCLKGGLLRSPSFVIRVVEIHFDKPISENGIGRFDCRKCLLGVGELHQGPPFLRDQLDMHNGAEFSKVVIQVSNGEVLLGNFVNL